MPTDHGIVNLCFHGIGEPGRDLEPGEDEYWVTATQYEEILDEIVAQPDVRISFDDGNASDIEIGLPGLRRRGLTATFFLIAGRVDTPGSLTAAGVAELRNAGMRIGTHGWDHRSWRGMDPAVERRELMDAAALLAELVGAPVTEAACPRGEYDRRALQQLRRARYHRVFTSDRRRARPDAWLQPRYSIRRTDHVGDVRALLGPQRSMRLTQARAAYHMLKRWR